MAGFSKYTRELVYLRSGGRCERCGVIRTRVEYHHRRPRGMGGSKATDTNGAANCVLLCIYCHRDIEAYRDAAMDFGFLVPQGKKPAETPLRRHKKWVLLDDFGYVTPVDSWVSVVGGGA